ncbi:MAG: hypothetical protein M3454_13195 [Actinomycetota bacterium]|nr:hypothetical protein [Actinomycetota bacterium]
MSVVALGRVAINAPVGRVAFQLARREGVRLIRHPIFLIGGLLSLALFGLLTWQAAPVLHRDDTNITGALLPLAAATMMVTNLAASRAARNGTDELYDGTVTSSALRAAGHLLSLTFAVVAAAGLVCVMFVHMLLDAPVGTPRIAEILTGPVTVTLLGAVGIFLGRWKPHPALGPIAVVSLIALEVLLIQPVIGLEGTSGGEASRVPWFAPWVPLSLTSEVPPELVIRPAAWHLLYLVGLGVLFAVLALARQGFSRPMIALLVAGAACTLAGAVGQVTPPQGAQQAALAALVEEPEEHQVCDLRRGITYCAYPAYLPWIDRWAKPVEGALDRVPSHARPQGLVVRQTFGTYFEGPTDLPRATVDKIERAGRRSVRAGESDQIFWTGTDWGRGETEGQYEIGLALYIATEAVGLPVTRSEMRLSLEDVDLLKEAVIPRLPKRFRAKAARRLQPGRGWSGCNTAGQARAAIAWWIAAEATSATRATVTRVATDNPYGLWIYEHEGQRIAAYLGPFIPLYPLAPPPMWDRVNFADAEFHYAAKLLKQPGDEIGNFVTERWDDLTAPTAATESFLADMGITRHQTIEEQIAALPNDVELEQGRRMWNSEAYRSGTIPCV